MDLEFLLRLVNLQFIYTIVSRVSHGGLEEGASLIAKA